MSQTTLAEGMGWAQTDVSKVERGVRRLDVLELRTWVATLGSGIEEFVRELNLRLESAEHLDQQARGRKGR